MVHRVRLELDSMEFGRGVLDKSVLALPTPRQERVLAELSPFLMERTASEPATQRNVCMCVNLAQGSSFGAFRPTAWIGAILSIPPQGGIDTISPTSRATQRLIP